MKIAIGSDHAGYELKEHLISILKELGHEIVDKGSYNTHAVDYPDFALRVAKAVKEHEVERGIMLCGSGVGACVAVNKVAGITGGLCHDTYSAHQGVEHDDVNVLVMGARVIGFSLAEDIVKTFLNARFSGEARYVKRLEKIKKIEKENLMRNTKIKE